MQPHAEPCPWGVPLYVIIRFIGCWRAHPSTECIPARTGSKSACADDPPNVSNGCCLDLRPFQPPSCRHGIVDPVISPKQDGFLKDEGGHLPDFSIGTRAEPVPEGTRRRLTRGGAGGTEKEKTT